MKLKHAPTNSEAAIFSRLTGLDVSALNPVAAQAILDLDFNATDIARMNELAAKSNAGTLSAPEQEEVEAYSRASSLLGVLQSKARVSLRRRSGTGRAKSSRGTASGPYA